MSLREYCPACNALQQEWLSRQSIYFDDAQFRGYGGENAYQRALVPPKCPRHAALDVLRQVERPHDPPEPHAK